MSHDKQFTLYTNKAGPNGWKAAFVLEELGLSYHPIYLDFGKDENKAPEFTKFNPNGRIPVIVDHANNDFVLWESGAILRYLTDKYDKDHKLSLPADDDEKYQELQWLFFQASGQGPYYGQVGWFLFYHAEKVPSALERYRKEILRVLGVLESILSKQAWLVGGRATVADISFVSWNAIATAAFLENFGFAKEFPATAAWHKKLTERPAIKKVWDERTRLLAQK